MQISISLALLFALCQQVQSQCTDPDTGEDMFCDAFSMSDSGDVVYGDTVDYTGLPTNQGPLGACQDTSFIQPSGAIPDDGLGLAASTCKDYWFKLNGVDAYVQPDPNFVLGNYPSPATATMVTSMAGKPVFPLRVVPRSSLTAPEWKLCKNAYNYTYFEFKNTSPLYPTLVAKYNGTYTAGSTSIRFWLLTVHESDPTATVFKNVRTKLPFQQVYSDNGVTYTYGNYILGVSPLKLTTVAPTKPAVNHAYFQPVGTAESSTGYVAGTSTSKSIAFGARLGGNNTQPSARRYLGFLSHPIKDNTAVARNYFMSTFATVRPYATDGVTLLNPSTPIQIMRNVTFELL